ncbi:MAG TPA: type II toxin-antitoxin system PemK/MazF family toxin [Candidatus Baltobacteraceae bacterium]|nr:type II toxin-antitoxin system PemK/MazF family toxin [Candidatus Baltobacteraceae bacterium]
MRRGELYRVPHPRNDPRRSRVFVIVSRQVLCDTSEYSTVICAPVYSSHTGLGSQVPVGHTEGLKHPSAIHCDGLVSFPKGTLTDYVGSLSSEKLLALETALKIALDLLD